jgi:hypothetical protein
VLSQIEISDARMVTDVRACPRFKTEASVEIDVCRHFGRDQPDAGERWAVLGAMAAMAVLSLPSAMASADDENGRPTTGA